MLNLQLLGDSFVSTWLAPIVGLIFSGVIVTVVTAVLSSRRDKRKEEEAAAKKLADEQQAAKVRAEREKDALVTLLRDQVTEMHEALLGTKATEWTPERLGLVSKVDDLGPRVKKIEGTLFGNGGVHNTVLDRLTRIEEGPGADKKKDTG